MPAWYRCLPPAVTRVPCGDGLHTLRWVDGALDLRDHPDAEAEGVLAALGGDKPGCLELAETWNRYTGDPDLLAVLPRSAADEVAVGWEDVAAYRDGPGGRGVIGFGSAVRRVSPLVGGTGWTAYAPLAGQPPPPVQQATAAQMPARIQHLQAEMRARHARRIDLLTLLALGPAFQFRLAGQIMEALLTRGSGGIRGGGQPLREQGGFGGDRSPRVTAALAGRAAPAVAQWLGIDPGEVAVTVHHGPGWGSVHADDGTIRLTLPASWLASVWACNLAVVDGHLVVSVTDPGWPDATVLGLRAPAAAPVTITVHGDEGPNAPRWVRHLSHEHSRRAGPRRRRCRPGPRPAVGGSRDRQDLGDQGNGERDEPAMRDGYRVDQGAVGLRWPAGRDGRLGAIRPAGLGHTACRPRPRRALP
jgi:hypothetical protein